MSREEIIALVEAGAAPAASAALARLFAQDPSAGTAAFVVSRFEQLASALPLQTVRIAILRSFTIEPLLPQLRARGFLAGLDLQIQVGDYNVFAQELLDRSSRLYQFTPDVVMCAALTRDAAPALWHGTGDAGGEAEIVTRQWTQWITAFRHSSHASLIMQSFEQPPYPTDGILDTVSSSGQRALIRSVNDVLAALAREHRGVYVLDYDALVARHGQQAWSDPHKNLAMRVPLRPDAYARLAAEYMRYLQPLTGRVCKAIAIDLDNTLWGGVVGEDGSDGLQLGTEYPGPAFIALQQQLKALKRRGVLLTVCSKNNPDDAMAILRDHPAMLLRPDDFAAMRINWDDKAGNLRALAAELNISVDSFAFLDDNAAERDWIRAQLPEVTVIELPADPVRYVEALRESPVFERLSVSDEDQVRTDQYRAERLRATGASSSGSVEEFLQSLEMRAAVRDLSPSTLARVAQLTQKTNQFNATTRRYTEEQVSRFAADGGIVRTVTVTDRYGDSGLVGVLMARVDSARCEIDTLLLSCRVIGKGVETLMLADAAAIAKQRGAGELEGWFLPTPKNAPASDLYQRHGFQVREQSAAGTRWAIDLTRTAIAPPAHIQPTTSA